MRAEWYQYYIFKDYCVYNEPGFHTASVILCTGSNEPSFSVMLLTMAFFVTVPLVLFLLLYLEIVNRKYL